MILGGMDVARVKPYWFGLGLTRALGLAPTPPANGGHPIPGRGAISATYPVDGVHQARITKGIGGWGIAIGEDKKRDR